LCKDKAWVTTWLLDQRGGFVKLSPSTCIIVVEAAQVNILHDMAQAPQNSILDIQIKIICLMKK